MVDEARQDPVEVEAAADVARHPAQRLGSMEEMGDLVGALRRLDDDAGRRGELDQEVGIDRRLVAIGIGADRENPPRRVVARDRDRDFADSADAIADSAISVAGDGSGIGRARALERSAHRAVGAWQVGQPAVAACRRTGHEPIAADLVNGNGPEAAALADREARLAKGFVEGLRVAGDPGEGRDRRQVCPASKPLAMTRDAMAVARPVGRRRAAATGAAGRQADARQAVVVRLRCGKEPLEIAEAIATVAAWVDAVVAKAAGITPRPNRVRVNPEHAGGFRDGEGGVDRTRRRCARHVSLMEEMSSRRPETTNLTVLANSPKVPTAISRLATPEA